MKEIREQAYINIGEEQYFVSTVNIGDMYYETMIFGSTDEEVNYSSEHYCESYKTEEEALKGHQRIIENIQGYLKTSNLL